MIGPPASGKGTIGKMLSRELNVPLINTGRLLREIPSDSIWYTPVHEAMDEGRLAPNNIVGGLLTEVITENPAYKKGYILDGWLRQISDLKFFNPKFDIVLYLNNSKETTYSRIDSRRVCEKEGHTFNLITSPPKISDKCDIDGSKLVRRKDDTKEVVDERYEEYLRLTIPVVEYFKKRSILLEVDAEGTPIEVFMRVKKKIRLA